jgi:hypothetical protein
LPFIDPKVLDLCFIRPKALLPKDMTAFAIYFNFIRGLRCTSHGGISCRIMRSTVSKSVGLQKSLWPVSNTESLPRSLLSDQPAMTSAGKDSCPAPRQHTFICRCIVTGMPNPDKFVIHL